MAAERYLSRRIPDLRVGNNIDEIDKKLIPASIHPCKNRIGWILTWALVGMVQHTMGKIPKQVQ